MRAFRIVTVVAILATALAPVSVLASAPCSRLDDLECLFGTYIVRSATKYRGGLTTESEAQSLVGSRLVLTASLFKYRDKEVTTPKYVFEVVTLPTEEGDIGPKDVGTFWGYEGYEVHPKRIVKLKIYAGTQYVWDFEVISPRKLLDAYDGFFYEATR